MKSLCIFLIFFLASCSNSISLSIKSNQITDGVKSKDGINGVILNKKENNENKEENKKENKAKNSNKETKTSSDNKAVAQYDYDYDYALSQVKQTISHKDAHKILYPTKEDYSNQFKAKIIDPNRNKIEKYLTDKIEQILNTNKDGKPSFPQTKEEANKRFKEKVKLNKDIFSDIPEINPSSLAQITKSNYGDAYV